jgi:hypothetical protein
MKLNEIVAYSTQRLLAAAFMLALTAYGYIGLFSRYMADDYNTWRAVNTHGLLGTQIKWYVEWTGRFSFTFTVSLLSLLGARVVRFLPGLLLTLWFVGVAWAVRRVSWRVPLKSSDARAFMFAGLIIFATLKTAPNVVQSLYWQAGALSYIAPLILFSFYLGSLSRSVRAATAHAARPPWLVLCGFAALTFAAGGFSDAYVALQTCGLLLGIIVCARYAPAGLGSRLRISLAAGLVGSLLALTVVVLAPGNGVRQTFYPPPPGLLQILKLSALDLLRFTAEAVHNHPLIFALLLLVSFMTALNESVRRAERGDDRHGRAALLVLIPAIVIALGMSCITPAFYGMSVTLPERAQVLLGFTFVCGVVAWGAAAGAHCGAVASPFVSRNAGRVVPFGSFLLLILMIAGPVATCVSTFALRGRARAYAADWDRQDEELRAAKESGASEVTVDQIGDFQTRLGLGRGDLHLRSDPHFWINQSVAKYYGIRSVAAREDAVATPAGQLKTGEEPVAR